jgi:hypothetical protein
MLGKAQERTMSIALKCESLAGDSCASSAIFRKFEALTVVLSKITATKEVDQAVWGRSKAHAIASGRSHVHNHGSGAYIVKPC